MTTYAVDATMQRSIERLRECLGAASNAEVIRRSIALLILAVDSADTDKRIELMDHGDGVLLRIPLAQ